MLHPTQMQKQLIRVSFYPATVFGSPVGENPQEPHSLGIVKRQDLVIKKVSGGESGFLRIHLGETNVGMGVDSGLLINLADPFNGSLKRAFRLRPKKIMSAIKVIKCLYDRYKGHLT